MTATDELRALLDERGVEHYDGTETICWRANENGSYDCYASAQECGTLYVNIHHATPEQAIAATLGKQPARLTAEQVRELIAPHLHARPTFDFGRHGAVCSADFQAIADALNATLGRGTCENIAQRYLDFLCSECGFVHYIDDSNCTGDGNDWNYCPNCGRAVE